VVHITDVSLEDTQAAKAISASKRALLVEGQALDVGTGIKTVQVHMDNDPYVNATPTQQDWLHWSAHIPETANSQHKDHKLVSKAIDNASHESYDTITFSHP
jgi:hypothetical protein